jgi:hypothetical protein
MHVLFDREIEESTNLNFRSLPASFGAVDFQDRAGVGILKEFPARVAGKSSSARIPRVHSMIRLRPRVASIVPALFFVALLPRTSAATVEIYPGPGIDTYRSIRYTVDVSTDGTNWTPAYVYQFSRKSVTYWWTGQSPSVNFVTIGADETIQVRVSKIGGAITGVDASPKSKPISGGKVKNGVATAPLTPGDKYWLTINGDDANPLFIFVDAPKPEVPAGATYFGPGIQDIAPSTAGHYKASSGETIYLDGGAWVRGNIDIRGTNGVHVMGPGILSGDLWSGEKQGAAVLPFNEFLNYAMITGDFYGGDHAVVEGITIVDAPGYNFFGGARRVSGIKIFSPWFYSTDAFNGVSHVDHSFVFNGDNIFAPSWAGVAGESVTYTACFVATALNSVFTGGYWGNDPNDRFTALAEDMDIRTYNADTDGPPLLAAVFQIWMDNSSSAKGYRNQTYRNIRIEGGPKGHFNSPILELKNFVYPWGGPTAVNPPLGNGYNIVFQDITVSGSEKYRNQLEGWDANNGWHGVVLDNFVENGQIVNPSNLARYFDVNGFVWDLSYTAPAIPCGSGDPSVADSPSEGSRGRIVPIEPCTAVPVAGR